MTVHCLWLGIDAAIGTSNNSHHSDGGVEAGKMAEFQVGNFSLSPNELKFQWWRGSR